jgi:hypothetical protein
MKPYVNVSENLEKFRELLRIAVDGGKSLAEKVDADWHRIKRLGGNRHIAKKIIYLYNPDRAFPIFKSEDLQFVEELGRKPESESLVRLKKSLWNRITVPPSPHNHMDAAPPQLGLEPLNLNNPKPKLVDENPNRLRMGDGRHESHHHYHHLIIINNPIGFSVLCPFKACFRPFFTTSLRLCGH